MRASGALVRTVLLGAALTLVSTHAASAQDRPTGTLVVSNMNDHTATVLDAASGRVLATLPTGRGPHEVAISHDGRWAVVSNYGPRGEPGNSITVIDVPGHRVARTIEIAGYERPHGMAFLPGDTLLAVTAESKKAVLLIDFRTGKISRVLPSNGRATHMLSLSTDGKTMVTANIADGTISVIHPSGTDSVAAVRVTAAPEGIVITPDGKSAWVGSDRDSVVVVMDLEKAQPVDTLHGFGLPYRLAITPDVRRAVVTDPVKAQVRIFDVATRRERAALDIPADSIVPTAEVPGSPSPEGVAISRDGRWAFVTLQGRNRVITIDLDSPRIVGWAPTGTWSDVIGFSPLTSARR
jgi:DNA-binding beta-propeller fold protein YncE